MSALCNQTMPLGFLEDELGDDLQSLMPGSPFDVLLGNQNVSVLDLSKVQNSTSLKSLVQKWKLVPAPGRISDQGLN